MAVEKGDWLKVVFHRLYVLDDADSLGSGEFYFTASISHDEELISIGDKLARFNAVERKWIDLPEEEWSAKINVRNRDSVIVKFHGWDADVTSDDYIGGITYELKAPFKQRKPRYYHKTRYFRLKWSVQLSVRGKFGWHPEDSIFSCREQKGGVKCTTVSGNPISARLEICPVRPVPWLGLPARPLFAEMTHRGVLNGDGQKLTVTSARNAIPNPSVIPILPKGEKPTEDNAARIEFTYYTPKTLNFEKDPDRLQWDYDSLEGGQVEFLGKKEGLKVFVYGKAEGQVRLNVYFNGVKFASYRALVRHLQKIECRVNIINGPTVKTSPRAKPSHVKNHIEIANRFLRQIALELVMDKNTRSSPGAKRTKELGIFRIRTKKKYTYRTSSHYRVTRWNYRKNVLNIAYIHSDKKGNLGAATWFPERPALAKVKDGGTPSSSWIEPSGVPLDKPAKEIEMKCIGGYEDKKKYPSLYALCVTGACGDPSKTPDGEMEYASTIVHELGHVLNLGHRTEGPDPKGVTPANPTGLLAKGKWWDGLNYPPDENIMSWGSGVDMEQDLDILQALAAHASPLIAKK